MSNIQSAERVSQHDASDNYVFQRSLLAYHEAAKLVAGDVLEIGTGSGYGVEIMAPRVESFTTVDKFDAGIDLSPWPNARFLQMNVPPLANFAAGSFDYVISFQVIEHIRHDFTLVDEVWRVLRSGGRFIVTTPNALMSLTRNPWHVREYTPDQLMGLLSSRFSQVEPLGVFGNDKVMEYYEKNRESVRRITRFDPLKLQYRLPRWMLQLPYDLLNRMNRRKLLRENSTLTTGIRMEDYRLDKVSDNCFDLFYMATKAEE